MGKSDGKKLQAFFTQEIKELDENSGVAVRAAADALVAEMNGQLSSLQSRGNYRPFNNAVKAYHFKRKGNKPPTSFVRLEISWLSAFQTGATINGNLWVLLDTGRVEGFPRVSEHRGFALAKSRLKGRSFTRSVPGGILVFWRNDAGRTVPVYKIQRQVKVPKRLTFFESAERLANQMKVKVGR